MSPLQLSKYTLKQYQLFWFLPLSSCAISHSQQTRPYKIMSFELMHTCEGYSTETKWSLSAQFLLTHGRSMCSAYCITSKDVVVRLPVHSKFLKNILALSNPLKTCL